MVLVQNLQIFDLKNLLPLFPVKKSHPEYFYAKTKLIPDDYLKLFQGRRCVEYENFLKEVHNTTEITYAKKTFHNMA